LHLQQKETIKRADRANHSLSSWVKPDVTRPLSSSQHLQLQQKEMAEVNLRMTEMIKRVDRARKTKGAIISLVPCSRRQILCANCSNLIRRDGDFYHKKWSSGSELLLQLIDDHTKNYPHFMKSLLERFAVQIKTMTEHDNGTGMVDTQLSETNKRGVGRDNTFVKSDATTLLQQEIVRNQEIIKSLNLHKEECKLLKQEEDRNRRTIKELTLTIKTMSKAMYVSKTMAESRLSQTKETFHEEIKLERQATKLAQQHAALTIQRFFRKCWHDAASKVKFKHVLKNCFTSMTELAQSHQNELKKHKQISKQMRDAEHQRSLLKQRMQEEARALVPVLPRSEVSDNLNMPSIYAGR
jgi:hypothetical protein